MNALRRLFGGGCLHRFWWPRIDANGRHYQVCLGCGVAYEYDWKMMRQTNHLLAPEVLRHGAVHSSNGVTSVRIEI